MAKFPIPMPVHYRALFDRYTPSQDRLRKVWCPECGADPGEFCKLKRGSTPRRPTGTRTSSHQARLFRYLDLRDRRDRRKRAT